MQQGHSPSSLPLEWRLFIHHYQGSFPFHNKAGPGNDATKCKYNIISYRQLISTPIVIHSILYYSLYIMDSWSIQYMPDLIPGSGDTRWINVCLKKLPVAKTSSYIESSELELRTPTFLRLLSCLACLSKILPGKLISNLDALLWCQNNSANLTVLTQPKPLLGQ